MKEIKIKPEGGKPKVMDSASKIPKTVMKDMWLRSKEKAAAGLKENPFDSKNESSCNEPVNCAADQIVSGGKEILQKGSALTYRGGKKLTQTMVNRRKEYRKASRAIQKLRSDRLKNSQKSNFPLIKGKPNRTVKSVKRTVKQSKNTIKRAKAAARTAQKTARTTVKTTQRAVKAAKMSAKVTVKLVTTAVKATAAAIKSVAAAIVAGGWVAAVIIIAVAVIAGILYSCYGIFFSGEDTGTGMTIRTAVTRINTEYTQRIETIKAENPHDEVNITGSRASWPEILSVYAVKTSVSQEVAAMDESKLEILRSIFWDFHTVSYRTEENEINQTDDEGNSETVTEKVLTVTVSHRTAEEMADQYGFTPEQEYQFLELLKPENQGLWSAALYGIGNGSGDLVTVAMSQVGNVGGEPYWSWYGFNGRVEWCACFVSWCGEQCGYIDAGVLPKFSSCTFEGVPWFQERGLWQDNAYVPNPGDIIFFNWDGDSLVDHVGIVEKVEGGRVYTIEGNSNDMCRQNRYPLGYSSIYGYGTLVN